MMLGWKQAFVIIAIVLLISIAAFWVWSKRKEPEPIVVYKATIYSPKMETQGKLLSNINSEVEMGTTSTNEEIVTSERNIEDYLDLVETDDFSDAVVVVETETSDSENEDSEDVPVSPHGFGAYPEVPPDFPIYVNWSDYEEDLPVYELMLRVQIKLWTQGHKVMGISEENGTMYPIIRGRVYVKWNSTGTEVAGVTGHPSDMSDYVVSQIESGNIPAGFTVCDYDTEGIDPYDFLNLY